MSQKQFKLTYGTMFNPPQELHEGFDKALSTVKAGLGQEYGLFIGGQDVYCADKFSETSPTDTGQELGVFQAAGQAEVQAAMEAAQKASGPWSATPWQERVAMVRKAADLIDERTFEMSAAMTLSVGKNRMECLGEVTETADLVRYSCDQMEQNQGYIKPLGSDPFPDLNAKNMSVLKPYGVWLVITPFNFPQALSGGPAGAALVTGNTVVIKASSDTPWTVRLLVDCFRDAGLPEGTVNFITGPGSSIGDSLVDHPLVDGITFTGSYDVGMGIKKRALNYDYVRPVILEMGGKNPTVVSNKADLDLAALGVMRSAFGAQGQKCSACSRVFVENQVFDEFAAKLQEAAKKIVVGDPCRSDVYMGPVINRKAYDKYQGYVSELKKAGELLCGGEVLTDGELSQGYFCAPTIAVKVPLEHRLWSHEMFLPITMLHPVADLEEGMALANDTAYGLTAGFYGAPDEVPWFFQNTHGGVTYANRPTGATTGAWPGYQPFGGWKGSGASGKNAGGYYYVPLYLREQIQAWIEW
ncbi:MAG: aldehyde dehydrogenase family protein [Desulfarculaceae bacterium]|nr:aldehyde dehydrogenase family protein [Desulfarculaceae bacterium]MCF8071177.1 aldehyde dehydrogenase family protein [Desulfarculaceae bacterium]MCF8101220.1 aldehyde dehydrogenase family protein [Desulfarculaceae bacterium]MCF8115231.1 aldehyde dehydrogenase family protein [Desulfarculaceae bacterium]